MIQIDDSSRPSVVAIAPCRDQATATGTPSPAGRCQARTVRLRTSTSFIPLLEATAMVLPSGDQAGGAGMGASPSQLVRGTESPGDSFVRGGVGPPRAVATKLRRGPYRE